MSDYDLTPGQMVGEYRVERKIGEGGFGKVYAALHPVIGKAAAVKILNPALASNQEMVTRFADEARAVNHIRHRNIIDIFAFGTLPNGLHYFVMELLSGMSLDSYLEKHAPLEPGHALGLLWPVGRALVAAHKAGIAHRDLKPENVFLTFDEDGVIFPKLLDFGIAKLLNESEVVHRTRTGVMMGTPLYMSPEQCRGSGVDHRSDIYSFGIMLHEVLTGDKPFMAETMMDLVLKQLGEPPPPMSTRRPDLPRSLDAPVLHMLEKAADRRPPTMAAALDELMAAARAAGIQVPTTLHAPGRGPEPARAAPVAPTAAQTAPPAQSAPPVETGAWLQQGNPATGPAPPPRAGYPAGPTAAQAAGQIGYSQGQGGAYPAGQGGYPQGHGGGHSASHGGAYPAGQPGAYPAGQPGAYPTGQGGAYPAGHGGAYPADHGGGHPGQAAPLAPRRSSSALGVFAALAAILFFLFVVGAIGFVAFFGSDTTVQIGATAPAPGTLIERDTTSDLQMRLTAPGEAQPRLTLQHVARRVQRITIRGSDGERVTRAEVDYREHAETTRSSLQGESTRTLPPANRVLLATLREIDIEVTAFDGQPVSDQEMEAVLDDTTLLFHPPIDTFPGALAVGDTIRPGSDAVIELLGFSEPGPDTTVRVDGASLKLLSFDATGHEATFQVSLVYVLDGTSPPSHVSAALQGTVTLDSRSGLPLKGSLSGPLQGTVTDSGISFLVSGSLSFEGR